MQNSEMFNSNFNNLINYLYKSIDEKSEEKKILGDFLELQKRRFSEEKNDTSRPFLTVITRTQGKRPDMLNETLLCLTGQSNTDFEYIIAGHNLTDEGEKSVKELIDDLPDWMKEKTRFLPVNGGTRTTPLIKAFEKANGKYIAILDDDDIVFDNWVDVFYETYKTAAGKILHSYVVYQDWETVSDSLPNTPVSVAKPSNEFCADFVMLNELTLNVCPLMSVAFPSYAFNVLKINFDESLTTTEDWDFLMRTAFICGVENNPTVTSIYRNWKNAENSQTVHGKEEWKKNYENILKRLMDTPMIFDRTGVEEYVEKHSNHGRSRIAVGSVELFYDTGDGFSAGNVKKAVEATSEGFHGKFENLEELGNLYNIRIDPTSKGNLAVFDLKVKLVFADGIEELLGVKDFSGNGFVIDGSTVFLKDDPQFVLNFSSPKKLKTILFDFMILSPVPDKYIDILIDKKHSVVYRALRKIKRIIMKVIG